MNGKERREAWEKLLTKSGRVRGAEGPRPAATLSVVSGESMRLSLIPESEWEQQVEQIASLFGWLKFHTYDARRSEEGFPDLILLRPPRLVVSELKKMGEDPRAEQLGWLRSFRACGAETYIWRPSDFDQVMEILR